MSPTHIPALTGLRAIAAGIVFIGHVIAPHNSEVPGLLQYGWVGVNIFFALSGYLFQYLYADELIAGSFRWWPYFKRRLIRIYPVTTLVVILSAISAWERVTLPDIGLHLTLLHGWFPRYRSSLNAPMWTLTLEESFYLIAPILIYYLRRFFDDMRRRLPVLSPAHQVGAMVTVSLLLWTVTFALGRGLASYHQDIVYHLLRVWDGDVFSATIFGRLSDFVAGMLAAGVMGIHGHRLARRGDILVGLGMALLIGCISFIHAEGGSVSVGEHKLGSIAINGIAASAAIIIAGLHAGGITARILSTRTAIILGECSFALYLIQFMPLGPFPKVSMGLQQILETSGLHFVAAALVCYVIMNIAAAGVHYFFERPVGIWLRKR